MAGKIVLTVASHPDDEVLGVGGTTCAHATAGDTVEILIVAEGVTSRHKEETSEAIKSRLTELRKAAEGAAKILGTSKPRFLGLPDQRLDTLPFLDIVQSIEKIITEVHPEIVYTHHANDLNFDHRIVHDAVLTACRPLPNSSVNLIRCFETLSSTGWTSPSSQPNFVPTDFIDITEHLEKKLTALAQYQNEVRAFPHARSVKAIRALAELRGATVGRSAAEAFMTVRRIERLT